MVKTPQSNLNRYVLGLVCLAVVVIAATVIVTRPSSIGEFSAPPRLTTTSEAVLRRRAIVIGRPSCPIDALAAGTDTVGITEVTVGHRGRVVHAEPVEPLSGPVADAMRLAADSSSFMPEPDITGQHVIVSAKLTFYFSRRGSRCEVSDPSQVGYVGRWPMPIAIVTVPTPDRQSLITRTGRE